MQKRIINSLLFLFAIHASVVNAQIYAYVEQKEYDSKEQKEVTKLGRAVINTQYSTPTVQFINGRAVMTIDKNAVASVSVIDGGVLVVEPLPFDKEEKEEAKKYNKITKEPTTERPYVTVFSPFQLVIPTGCEVYAPEYNASTQMLRLNNGNKIPAGAIVPAETPLVVKGTQRVDFQFSVNAATCAPKTDLSGTAVRIKTPQDGTVYTFGRDKNDLSLYGLFRYVSTTLPPGVAYLKTNGAATAKFIPMQFDDDDPSAPTDILNTATPQRMKPSVVKQIVNGQLLIKRGGKVYNANGQEIIHHS
jgi:hypothetical protein